MANYKSRNLAADSHDGKKKLNPKIIYDILVSAQKKIFKAGLIVSAVVFGCCLLTGFLAKKAMNLVPIAETLVFFGFLLIPLASFGAVMLGYYREMNVITKGEYHIIADTIERVVTDDKVVRRGRSYYMEHAMYLYRCGRVVISLNDTYVNSEKDVCYVLVYNKNPDVPMMVFNQKFYELEDLDGLMEKGE